MITDEIAELIEAGVVNGARKSVDRGLAVTGLLLGTGTLVQRAAADKSILLRDTRYTHDQAVLAAQHALVAINSAIEVDLTGQSNIEVASRPLRRRHRQRRGLPARRGPVARRDPGDRPSLDHGAAHRRACQPHRGPAARSRPAWPRADAA